MFADYQQPFSVCESLLSNDRGCLTLLIWSKGWCGPTLCHFCLFGGLFGRFYHVLSTIIKAQDKLNATSKSVLFNRKKVEELWPHSKWGFHKRVPYEKAAKVIQWWMLFVPRQMRNFQRFISSSSAEIQSIYLSINRSIYSSILVSIYLSIHPSICLYIHLSSSIQIYPSFYLSI